MLRLLILMLIAFAFILLAVGTSAQERKHAGCQSGYPKMTAKYFKRRYNMTSKLFTFATLFQNKLTLYPGVPDVSLEPNGYFVRVNVKKNDFFEPLRTASALTLFFHLYHGDAMTCHDFHPITGEYKTQKIGPGGYKYSCVIPEGHYYSVDFESGDNKKFAFVGVVGITGNERHSVGDLETYSKTDMIEKFPQHRDVIESYYGGNE